MISYILVITLVLIGLHLFLRYRKFGRQIAKISGPTAYPLVGNGLDLLFKSQGDIYSFISRFILLACKNIKII